MVFVDTGAWIALSDKSDQHHQDAITIYASLKQRQEKFLTTDYVIDETVTRLRYDASHIVAVQFLDLIDKSEQLGVLKVISIDAITLKDAIAIFRQYNSALLSLTDCTSFAACRKLGIHEVFSFDQHFVMMGITLCKR